MRTVSLLFVSKPPVLGNLDSGVEQAAITKALKGLEDRGLVKLCWTTSGTFDELKRRLIGGDDNESWDVMHFIGHGDVGRLAMEVEGSTGVEWVDAAILKGFVAAPTGPQLVVLNTCKGAQGTSGDRFVSTAQKLARNGAVAAVVAMQFEITDVMAIYFSSSFYGYLADKQPVQVAMTATRLDLQQKGLTEWISPVLYMQNKDGSVTPPPSRSVVT
jgi:CHAT domain